MDKLPEATNEEAKKWAVVFDFDEDSCYPSPAIFADGTLNPGLDAQAWDGVTDGCREPAQLENSNTYYRKASIQRNGVEYGVHMYALYFLKDKIIWGPGDVKGHRHDWEFALVWTTDDSLTHASFSHHGEVETRERQGLHFDAQAPNRVKVVYHKDGLSTGGITHAMRFAKQGEAAENHLGRWITPTIVNWFAMVGNGITNETLRNTLNDDAKFGEADCSVNDVNFAREISKNPPPAPYPSGDEWKVAAYIEQPRPVHIEEILRTTRIKTDKTNVGMKINRGLDKRRDKTNDDG